MCASACAFTFKLVPAMPGIGAGLSSPLVLLGGLEGWAQRRKVAGYASGGITPEFCPSYDALRLRGSLVRARECASGKRIAQVAGHAGLPLTGVARQHRTGQPPHVRVGAEMQKPPLGRSLYCAWGSLTLYLEHPATRSRIPPARTGREGGHALRACIVLQNTLCGQQSRPFVPNALLAPASFRNRDPAKHPLIVISAL